MASINSKYGVYKIETQHNQMGTSTRRTLIGETVATSEKQAINNIKWRLGLREYEGEDEDCQVSIKFEAKVIQVFKAKVEKVTDEEAKTLKKANFNGQMSLWDDFPESVEGVRRDEKVNISTKQKRRM